MVPPEGGVRQCNMIEEFAPPRKILESKSTTTTICGPFSFSSLPRKGDQKRVVCFSPGRMATYVVFGLPTRMPSWSKSPFYTSKDAGSKETCAKDVFFSTLSSPKAKGETASLSFDSSFGFPKIAVAGAKPTFLFLRMREKVRGKNTFSLCEIRKWRTHSILWVRRIKRKTALSWQSFRWQETLGLVGASDHNKSKPKTDQDSWALTNGRPPFTLEEQKAQGIAGCTNVNDCKLRCLNTIGADHTRCYHGSKRGQAVTIERLSLSIPSHTGKEFKWQGKAIRPFGSSRSIAHIQTSDWGMGQRP
ncbi:60S ribosomal protein L2, mitochondrial [Capsicum annuum]|uniref:60S ribosomal protein L2, mitochondrial n=1 Tax=Capsicum annuum TaxID=4072 RepID=A0A2G2YYL5_CAPAN|nr:60S ribosomal protein L2, mitochondrial [Capsicum annuum]